jgi:hypothetical protein
MELPSSSKVKFDNQHYVLYQLAEVTNYPLIFEDIFKFPQNELNFIQKDIKPSSQGAFQISKPRKAKHVK